MLHKMCIFSFHILPFEKSLFILPFYRQFRICITNASCEAHTPKVALRQRLPPGGSSRRSRVRESALPESQSNLKVTQAPSVTLRVPPSSRRKAMLPPDSIKRSTNKSSVLLLIFWQVKPALWKTPLLRHLFCFTLMVNFFCKKSRG